MQTPDTFYLVAVQFQTLGFGSAGDLTDDWDHAVDVYADLYEGDEGRVFRLEMDADNNPASFVDVTDNAIETIRKRLYARRYFPDEVAQIVGAA